MDNIRNIKEKIKSCMSCNEDQCPIIKERLDRHVQSHHSSTGQIVNIQNLKLGRSSVMLSSRSAITMTTSSAQTSTSDLITDQFDERANKPVYRKHLGELINEWADQLPSYSNASSENLKQNIVNELIEKLNNISSEASEGYYDLKLGIEIDKFIDSLPLLSDKTETDFDFGHLKETLIKKICDLNENILSKSMKCMVCREDEKQEHETETEIKTKDNATNTLQSFKNNLQYTDRQNNETSTPYTSLSDNNESVTELNLENKNKEKKLVDAQVQPSFTSIKPFYGNNSKNPTYKFDKQKHTDVIENCYKQILLNWLQYLTKKLDKNEKNIITDAIWNRLKPLLYKKYTINHKILLTAEILNCLNDYTNMLIGPENYSQINKISEDLAVKLLVVKINNEEVISMLLEPYFQKGKDKMLQINFGNESNLDPIVQNIVQEKLENLNISNLIKRNIINIILQNIKLICMQQDHYIETLIFDILQHYTKLSDYCLSTLVRSILDQIRIVAASNCLQIYNSRSLNDSFKTCRPSLISVYKSEHEMRCPNNGSSRRKSSDINYPQLTAEERKYVDNISELIKAWMTILPINSGKTASLKTKESVVNNLAQDILDQVKLEQIVPETRVEKEKYLSFFIHRWLNRLNCFKNISDAQPYTEKLIDKIKDIPGPSMSKNYNRPLNNVKEIITPPISCYKESCVNREPITNNARTNVKEQNRENTLKSEVILKEFITKYIEHNHDEDNPITRDVFGHILKSELQKLSIPTRKTVYGNLTNQVDNILASEKLATELQYINIISDWFKTLPLESSFNVTGNKQRAQYVNNLAKIISDLEEKRFKIPSQMDYNRHLKSTVSQFTDKLPIVRQYSNDMSFLIDDFIDKINSLRPPSPCCAFANERDLSLNASSIPYQNLSDFIEAYIRENSDEIVDDQLKLDAWSLRIFEEVDNMASENPSALSTSQVYNRLANISEQGDDIGKRFNLKLSYAKEISNWLNNLPLQPIVDTPARDLRVKMISNLAEKMSFRWFIKNMDPNNTQADIDLADYIKKWIIELPLDPNKEIVVPFVIQQLLNRMERVNTGKQKLLLQQQPQNDTSNMCPSPHYCCNRQAVHRLRTLDPGQVIVEAIEKWCKNLPIQSESESDNITLLEEFSTRLFRKVSELNKNPDYFNNNFLYMQSLAEEIDAGLDQLPQNPQLQKTRQNLKQQILDIIKENKNLMSEKAAGVEYRQELAKTIEMSLPNPGPLQPKHSPGFNIYKNCLVEMFILENFDYAQDNVKLNYVKRLRQKLDNYFEEVQKMNSLLLTKEQIFNELYSSLFSVPPPNEISIVEEVEEVKTRCEIENWFESLPIREATGLAEIFEWDQILSMLAKRIHYMEKYEKKSDENIFKEIMKWLLRLPIMSGQNTNLNDLANDLLERLKLTFNDRKCESRNRNMSREQPLINKNKNIGVFGTSQVAGPSSGGMPWLSPPSSPSPENFIKTPKRPSDLILDIVETWCEQLPLPENTQQEKDNAKLLKDNLVVKIIMKISELNANSETFENDVLYDVILDDELENLLSTLPPSNDLMQNKTEQKNQLKYAIKEIKPLIKEEKERYEYKQELKNTVNQVLEVSPPTSPENNILLITLRDEIVDNFVAYSFCKDDEEGQEVHKTMVHDAVDKYYVGNKNTKGDEGPDPLMKGNQLLCELAKVPVPSAGVILEEIHEIKMKFQIADLFKDLSLTDDPNKLAIKNQVKSTLARRLSDFDKTSFSENHNKVKDNIMKCLKKIQNDIDPQKVEMFIEKLETSENRRKSQISPENNIKSGLPRQDSKNNFHTPYRAGENFANNDNFENQQWMSLLPATPRVRDPNYHDTIEFKEFRKTLGDAGSPQELGNAFDRSITQSEISYNKFKKGALSSSIISKQQPIHHVSNSIDKSKVIDQSQCCSVNPSNTVVLSQGYQPMDNNASQILGSAPKSHKNSGQQTSLESHNIKARLVQQMDNRPGLPKTLISPHLQNSYSRSQQNIPSLIRNRSHSSTQNQSSQSQGSQQPIYMPTDHQNQMSTLIPKNQYNSMPIPSQLTLQNRDVPPRQNQYRAPSPYKQASASQNIPGSCQVSDTQPPQAEFSSQTPYSSPRCNKSCRRPSIALLKPPEKHWSNNQDVQGNISISDDSDSKCSCKNIKKKQCRGSPVCPLQMRKQCRIFNGVNPFYYSNPPYRYYRY